MSRRDRIGGKLRWRSFGHVVRVREWKYKTKGTEATRQEVWDESPHRWRSRW